MSTYMVGDYNARIADYNKMRDMAPQYQKIADAATNPEEKKRYTEAAANASKLSSLAMSQATSIAENLGIDKSMIGSIIPPEEYNHYVKNGSLHKQKSGINIKTSA